MCYDVMHFSHLFVRLGGKLFFVNIMGSWWLLFCWSCKHVHYCHYLSNIISALVEYTWHHSVMNTCTSRLQIRLANFISFSFGTSTWSMFYFSCVYICCFITGVLFINSIFIVAIYTQVSGRLILFLSKIVENMRCWWHLYLFIVLSPHTSSGQVFFSCEYKNMY